MEFYEKWNRRWCEHVKKNRIKMLYACDEEQINFLNGVSIVKMIETTDSRYSFLECSYEVILEYNGTALMFGKVERINGEQQWYENENAYLSGAYVKYLLDTFPFMDMFKEMVELRLEKLNKKHAVWSKLLKVLRNWRGYSWKEKVKRFRKTKKF